MPKSSYKVFKCKFDEAEVEINKLAAQGWKVVTATSYITDWVLIIFEKR